MIKKTLLLIFISVLSLNSFSYSQLSFGAGIVSYDTDLFDGTSGTYYADFSGYTDNNLVYSVGLAYEYTDVITVGGTVEVDVTALLGGLGYAFGDLEEGAITLGGTYMSLDYSGGGETLSDNEFLINLAYQRMAEVGTNFSVGLNYKTACDNDESCESLFGQVEFPIGTSEWNFRVRGALDFDGVYGVSIGPTVKF